MADRERKRSAARGRRAGRLELSAARPARFGSGVAAEDAARVAVGRRRCAAHASLPLGGRAG